MMPDITVVIETPQELNHASYVQTGLFELEHMELITVKIKFIVARRRGRVEVGEDGKLTITIHPFPKASYYTIKDKKTGKCIRFATDLYDHAELFSKTALDTCDFYFKRSYESCYITKLPEHYQKKIKPLGLVFGVKSEYFKSESLWFLGLLLNNLNLGLKPDRLFFSRLVKTYRNQINHWRFIKTTRLLNQFEEYKTVSSPVIIFQTRCFEEKNSDVLEIHQQRYRIIKLLQKYFSDYFKGGFAPSKISELKYQDALTNVSTEPRLYLEALKQAKIVVYTRGLANSPAWKMAEYLSQGKVIIAEPLITELPVPLEHGKHVLYFNNDDELISNIKKVLGDEVLCDTLSKNARRYFEMNVHPAKNIKRILDLMIYNPDALF